MNENLESNAYDEVKESIKIDKSITNLQKAQSHYQGQLDDIDTTLTRGGFERAVVCPVTGLTVIEEIQEALCENTEAIAALQGHVIPRVDALENTVVQIPIDVAAVYNLHHHKVAALERVLDALQLTVQTLPKQLAISRLGGRITNLDERMHSLAGTFTDHEELTQVRQEQLRTELLIRLDPPVL